MANTYTWVIEAMDCVPQEDGQTDVVIAVHWRLNGTDGTNTATVYGTVGLTYTPRSPFTPYTNLTQDQVIAWTQDALGDEQVASLEANVAAQLANLVNPPVVSPPLPWAA
jgi:hypothetical protein